MNTSSLRGVILASLIAVTSTFTLAIAPTALADPVTNVNPDAPEASDLQNLDEIDNLDDLIKALDESSEHVSAKNEEFKQLQDDIAAKEHSLATVQEQATAASAAAEEAREEEKRAKEVVDKLAAAKYRGSMVDPLTTAINSDGPQNAIDRSAYMSAYLRKAQAALDLQREKSAEAARMQSEVARLEAESEFQINDLNARKVELEKQEAELQERIADIESRIDALSPEDRAEWENKNNPVEEYNLDDVTSTNGEGMQALQAAMTKIGAPYGWGAAGPDAFDCSGLVVWSYAQQGKTLPRTSQAQMASGMPVDINELQPGDVVGFYPGATHVGLYAGDGKIVHASDYGIPLQVVNMDSMPFYGARRY